MSVHILIPKPVKILPIAAVDRPSVVLFLGLHIFQSEPPFARRDAIYHRFDNSDNLLFIFIAAGPLRPVGHVIAFGFS